MRVETRTINEHISQEKVKRISLENTGRYQGFIFFFFLERVLDSEIAELVASGTVSLVSLTLSR